MPVFLIFLLYGAAEIFTFSKIGEAYGYFNAVFALLVAAVLGLGLVRNQARFLLLSLQNLQRSGKAPGREVIHAVLLFFSGVLFIVPGFLAHAAALLLLLPGSRHFIAWLLTRKITSVIASGGWGKMRFSAQGEKSGDFRGGFQVFTFGSGSFDGFRRKEPSSTNPIWERDVSPTVIDVQPVGKITVPRGGSGDDSGDKT